MRRELGGSGSWVSHDLRSAIREEELLEAEKLFSNEDYFNGVRLRPSSGPPCTGSGERRMASDPLLPAWAPRLIMEALQVGEWQGWVAREDEGCWFWEVPDSELETTVIPWEDLSKFKQFVRDWEDLRQKVPNLAWPSTIEEWTKIRRDYQDL